VPASVEVAHRFGASMLVELRVELHGPGTFRERGTHGAAELVATDGVDLDAIARRDDHCFSRACLDDRLRDRGQVVAGDRELLAHGDGRSAVREADDDELAGHVSPIT
jgi:hypothetical protein